MAAALSPRPAHAPEVVLSSLASVAPVRLPFPGRIIDLGHPQIQRSMSLSKCHPEAAFAKDKPAHPALLALLWSAALVLGAWPCVGAATVSLVSDPPPQPLSAWQTEKVGVGFPPQWLPVLLGFHGTETTRPVSRNLALACG